MATQLLRHHLLKDYVVPSNKILSNGVKIPSNRIVNFHMYLGSFWDFLFCSLVSIHVLALHCFNYRDFITLFLMSNFLKLIFIGV